MFCGFSHRVCNPSFCIFKVCIYIYRYIDIYIYSDDIFANSRCGEKSRLGNIEISTIAVFACSSNRFKLITQCNRY